MLTMLILITGGSKNGKSRIAEDVLSKTELPKFYIATMEPYCPEAQEAIERHRAIRAGKGFETVEKYTDIGEIILPRKCAVLLECICNLCANEMFSKNEKAPADKIVSGIKTLSEKAETLVIVTNQVGGDGIEYPSETMDYIKNMGEINCRIAEIADTVIEAVCGIPLFLKGGDGLCVS